MNRGGYVLIQLKIRDFKIEDYDNLIQLWRKANLPFKPEGRDRKEKMETELERGCAIFLVAELEGRIIGSIFGTHDGRKGWINRLAVAPDMQRAGVGKRLLKKVEQRLDEQGIDIIACLVEDWNKDSLEFFEKTGYIKHNDIFYFSKRKNRSV
jgi:ribosomal protein S18 acetylase RimI-like enzyme